MLTLSDRPWRPLTVSTYSVTRNKMRRLSGWALLLCCFVVAPVRAATRVDYFAVSQYTQCPGWGSLSNTIASASGFRSLVVNAGSFTAGLSREDAEVADIHFMDPAYVSGGLDSNGTVGFDRPSPAVAISFFSGHGWCGPNGSQGQDSGGIELPDSYNCTSSSQCFDPPPSTTLPGRCVSFPTGLNRPTRCAYSYKHYLKTCSPSVSQYADKVTYSYGDNKVFWGESSTAGSWAGAGTNGSVNVAVLEGSCLAHIPSWNRDFDGFAGVRVVLVTAPHFNGDTAMTADRGPSLAQGYVTGGDNATVASAWEDAVDLTQGGNGCTGGDSSGTGFNGCGANILLSSGATTTEVLNNRLTTWGKARNEAYDANGNNVEGALWFCNWDCYSEPPTVD